VLKDGSTVRYDAVLGDKGWHATRVERVEQIEVKVRQTSAHSNSPRR